MGTPWPAFSSVFEPNAVPTVRQVPHLEDITPDWAWGGSSGERVKVAIIDSGVDAGHEAIGGVQGYVAISEAEGGLVYTSEPHDDVYGHGTACAGIVRALAPACELYSVRVLGPGLLGRGVIFAAGLRWAIEHGMHVCNLSLGTTRKEFFSIFHELTDLAYFRNVALITAANNMPVATFPSMYASVISVASHDVPDPYRFYYNPEPPVEFGAYGVDVRLAWRNGGWITGTGNSYAAPHISGLVTRILGKHPGLTVFQLKTILRALAANLARETSS
jgi:subtilisin